MVLSQPFSCTLIRNSIAEALNSIHENGDNLRTIFGDRMWERLEESTCLELIGGSGDSIPGNFENNQQCTHPVNDAVDILYIIPMGGIITRFSNDNTI